MLHRVDRILLRLHHPDRHGGIDQAQFLHRLLNELANERRQDEDVMRHAALEAVAGRAAIFAFAVLGKLTDWMIAAGAAPFLRWQDAFARPEDA